MQSKFVLWCMYNSYDRKFNNNAKYVPKITCLKSKAIIVFLVLKNKCKISTSEFLYIFLNLHTSNQIDFSLFKTWKYCSRKNYLVIWNKLCSHFPFRLGIYQSESLYFVFTFLGGGGGGVMEDNHWSNEYWLHFSLNILAFQNRIRYWIHSKWM